MNGDGQVMTPTERIYRLEQAVLRLSDLAGPRAVQIVDEVMFGPIDPPGDTPTRPALRLVPQPPTGQTIARPDDDGPAS